jgi:hypothetical protein
MNFGGAIASLERPLAPCRSLTPIRMASLSGNKNQDIEAD